MFIVASLTVVLFGLALVAAVVGPLVAAAIADGRDDVATRA